MANEWSQFFGPYYGVDRLPPTTTPEHEFWLRTGLSVEEVSRALEEYEDCFPNPQTHDLLGHRMPCDTLLRALDPKGQLLEILLCEVVDNEDASYFADLPSGVVQVQDIENTYGYDVSWSNCNHSAIYQPTINDIPGRDDGLEAPFKPSWKRQVPANCLNRYGLFDSYEDATNLRNLWNSREPEPSRMHIFLVHSARVCEKK